MLTLLKSWAQPDAFHTVLSERSQRWYNACLRITRDRIIDELTRCNIGTSVHFIPVHLHPYYRDTYGYAAEDFPRAIRIYRELVSLPLYPAMTPEDVASVCRAVRAIVEQYRAS